MIMGDKHSLKVWLSYRIYSLNKSTITTPCRNGVDALTGYSMVSSRYRNKEKKTNTSAPTPTPTPASNAQTYVCGELHHWWHKNYSKHTIIEVCNNDTRPGVSRVVAPSPLAPHRTLPWYSRTSTFDCRDLHFDSTFDCSWRTRTRRSQTLRRHLQSLA